jgi:hypothetical protein
MVAAASLIPSIPINTVALRSVVRSSAARWGLLAQFPAPLKPRPCGPEDRGGRGCLAGAAPVGLLAQFPAPLKAQALRA